MVVEDEESFSEALSFMLKREGFEVEVADDGNAALEVFEQRGADLILLDLMLPGLSGLEVCRIIRSKSQVPIIMLTAKDGEIDKVVGLEIGADDYVTKPFSSRELLARVRSVLRRNGEPEELLAATNEAGPVRMDVDRHVVTVRGQQVSMPLKEFDLLEILVRNAGRVLTRSQLIDRVWGADYVGDTKTLDVHVKRLRAKVEEEPSNEGALAVVDTSRSGDAENIRQHQKYPPFFFCSMLAPWSKSITLELRSEMLESSSSVTMSPMEVARDSAPPVSG